MSQRYEGTAENLQDALAQAVAAAQDAAEGADILTEWKLVEVSGQAGGIDGRSRTTVTIEVQGEK